MVDQAERLREISKNNDNEAAPEKTGVCRMVAVSSGKGGVGKTNFVVNLALLLAQWDQRVTVIDADLGLANVDVLINAIPKYTLTDVINGTKDIQDITLKGPYNLKVIPGGSGFASMANLDIESRNRLISKLKVLESENDVILIDTGAGISRNVLSFVGAAEEFIIITTPEPTALTDAYGMLKILSENGFVTRASVVVNFSRDLAQGQEIFNRLERVLQRYVPNMEVSYLGAIINDPIVKRAVEECKPFVVNFPKSLAAQSVNKIARRFLYQEDTGEVMERKGVQGFINRLMRLIK